MSSECPIHKKIHEVVNVMNIVFLLYTKNILKFDSVRTDFEGVQLKVRTWFGLQGSQGLHYSQKRETTCLQPQIEVFVRELKVTAMLNMRQSPSAALAYKPETFTVKKALNKLYKYHVSMGGPLYTLVVGEPLMRKGAVVVWGLKKWLITPWSCVDVEVAGTCFLLWRWFK